MISYRVNKEILQFPFLILDHLYSAWLWSVVTVALCKYVPVHLKDLSIWHQVKEKYLALNRDVSFTTKPAGNSRSNFVEDMNTLQMGMWILHYFLQCLWWNCNISPQVGCVWPIDLWEIEAGGRPAQEDHQIQIRSLQPLEPSFNSDQLQSHIFTSEPAGDPHTRKVGPGRMG